MIITEALYDHWNAEKKKISWQNDKKYMPIHHRDIWYVKSWIKSILLSQARVLDGARFISKIWKIDPEEFVFIKQKIATLYGY